MITGLHTSYRLWGGKKIIQKRQRRNETQGDWPKEMRRLKLPGRWANRLYVFASTVTVRAKIAQLSPLWEGQDKRLGLMFLKTVSLATDAKILKQKIHIYNAVCWLRSEIWLMPEFTDMAIHWMNGLSRLLKHKVAKKDCTAIQWK